MYKRNTFYLLGLIFSLIFFLSCTKKVIKPKVKSDIPAEAVSDTPAGGVPAGGVPAGGVPAGGVPAGGVPAGAVTKLELISPSPIKPIKAGDSINFYFKGGVPPIYFFSTNYGKIEPSQLKVTGTALITARYTAPQTAGTATVSITDSKNNIISAEIEVYTPLMIDPPSLTLTKNMNYKFTQLGGVKPYAFFSKIGTINSQTGSYVAPSDKTGEEIITLYDGLGNKTTSTVTINPDLTIVPTKLDMTPNGLATFTIIGGIPPYTFSASPGTINSSWIYKAPSSYGKYDLIVEDSKGKKATSTISINQGLGITPARKNLQTSSTQTFTASGGTIPYKFSASIGKIDPKSGAYTAPETIGKAIITVSDGSEKTQTAEAEINIYLPINVSPTEFTLAVGNTKQFSASEGVPPYKFSTSTNIGTIDSATGIFTASNIADPGKVTVTDLEGNKVDAIVTINPKLELKPKTHTMSVNKNYFFTAENGVFPYTFTASNGTIGEYDDYTAPSVPGNYTITVTDSLENTATSLVTVIPKVEFKESTKLLRPGESLLLEVIGGLSPFTFETTSGTIDDLGLYHFPVDINESEVRVKDSIPDTATLKIIADFKNLWTWMSGTNSLNHLGPLEPGPGDKSIPAAKIGSVGWTDLDGNLWLFGGARGLESFANDLWKYNINLNQWTLVNPEYAGVNYQGYYGEKGVGSTYTFPGGRYYSNSWTDKEGNFWLFGGGGYGGYGGQGGSSSEATGLNDLWKYDPKKNLWTWMSGSDEPNQPGSNNVPGARHSSIGWTDKEGGNLWLFGGYGKAPEGWLNDLWKYNILANSWTRVSGSSSLDQTGKYGTKGTPSINNFPGGRQNGLSWYDSTGNLWLFGGYGYGSSDKGFLNDLWKFDTANKWTWVSGSDSPIQIGKYGNMGEASPVNIPGGRQTSISWTDKSGNLWLFGGYNSISGKTYYNDLWKFNITDGKWTWVSGSDLPNHPGNYGVMGEPSINNMPGARESEISWYDSNGNLWFFGGFGYGSSGKGFLNDLWKYTPK